MLKSHNNIFYYLPYASNNILETIFLAACIIFAILAIIYSMKIVVDVVMIQYYKIRIEASDEIISSADEIDYYSATYAKLRHEIEVDKALIKHHENSYKHNMYYMLIFASIAILFGISHTMAFENSIQDEILRMQDTSIYYKGALK